MTFEEFNLSITQKKAPANISKELEALWYDQKGDWERAHQIAQSIHSNYGSWIHAYLHRKERDLSNATYWYSRAGKQMHNGTLEEEWEELVQYFL